MNGTANRPDHDCDRHEQGRTCYAVCGCRCLACTVDNADYERDRQRQIAYGTWQPYVDAEPVRRHVRSLMADEVGATDGIGWKRIARLADVPASTVWKLLYGDPSRGQEPSKRVRPETARKLLAVRGRVADRADGATVKAVRVWQVIGEMLDGGFCKAELGRLATGNPDTRSLQLSKREVTVGNAKRIYRIYRAWKAGDLQPLGKLSRHDDVDVDGWLDDALDTAGVTPT